ncbi:MAG: carboxypeptidase-like regulatory domain-containing protein, partial [bacterium]
MRINYKYYLLIIVIHFFSYNATGQKYTISGYVKDSLTNDFLIGATIQIAATQTGISSNAYGFYSTQVERGNVILEVNYIGYERKSITINLLSDISLDIRLAEKSQMLKE